MPWQFISSTARATWAAGTTQTGQLTELAAAWAGQVALRYYSAAGTHLATVTHDAWVLDTTTDPYSLRPGAWVAESHIVGGTAAYCVCAVPGGSDILRADVSMDGAISDPGGRVRLDIGTRLRVQATASLPIGTELETFAAAMSAGDLTEYTSNLPSLNAVAASGSRPWDTTALSIAELGQGDFLLDWSSMMDVDPTTRRYYASGGRPVANTQPLKMVIFDELANEIRAIDQWSGTTCGHIYRSTTVMPGPRRVIYFPHGGGSAMLDIDAETHVGALSTPPTNIGGFSNNWDVRCVCWHPTLGSQGSIIWANKSRNRIVKFDWASQTWSALGNYDGTVTWAPYFGMHFHPLTGKVIACASETTANAPAVIIDSSGTLSLTASAPCATGPGGGSTSQNAQFFPHPTRDASISVCHTTNKFWTYEWSSNTWVDRGALPAELQSFYLIAAPTSWGALFFKYGSGGTSKAYAWKPGF